MSTRQEISQATAVISVNPVSKPSGALHPESILRQPGFADRSDRAVHNALKFVFGVNGSQLHARRTWTFRLIIGTLLMCLGLMFLHPVIQSTSEVGDDVLALAMIVGGSMIACGLFTRIVSLAMSALFLFTLVETGMETMLGYVCCIGTGLCLMALVFGSGRYSLDTLVFNALTPLRHARIRRIPLDHRAYRRMR